MEISHLHEFLVYAKTLNYTAAAKELYIAQPTLCQHIAKLANELNVTLVSQEGKPHLTVEGEILSTYAQAILADYDRLKTTLGKTRTIDEGAIRIIDIRESLDFAAEIRRIRTNRAEELPPIDYIGEKKHFQKTEFEVLDDDLADISFTFAPMHEKEPFSDESFKAYDFLSLPAREGLLVVGWNHPLAAKPELSRTDVAAMQAVIVKTPFWLRSEEALLATLRKNGPAISAVQGTVRSKFILPASDPNFFSFALADAVAMNPKAYSDDVAVLALSNDPLQIRPFAITRKDNPNPALGRFMELWSEALSDKEAVGR